MREWSVRLAACAGLVLLLGVVLPIAAVGRSASRVTMVGQYQRYAGEEGLGVGFGSIWVGSADNGESVARVDVATSQSTSIRAPSDEDAEIGVGPDAVWMSDFSDGIVRRIDPATDRITASTKGLPGASGFAFSGRVVWVALHHGEAVAELDGRTGRLLARVAVPKPGGGVTAGGPGRVALGFGSIWTGVPNLAAVVRLDRATHRALAVIPAGADCCGDVEVAGGSVWFTSGGSVDRIDPKTNEVSSRIHLTNADGLLARLAVIHGRLWAAPDNTIVEIDPLTARVVSRTPFTKASFKDLVAGSGALWAWDATTNQIDQLRVG
jgi:streptogramin lyase